MDTNIHLCINCWWLNFSLVAQNKWLRCVWEGNFRDIVLGTRALQTACNSLDPKIYLQDSLSKEHYGNMNDETLDFYQTEKRLGETILVHFLDYSLLCILLLSFSVPWATPVFVNASLNCSRLERSPFCQRVVIDITVLHKVLPVQVIYFQKTFPSLWLGNDTLLSHRIE